jgi:hypothetical protein
MADVLVGARDPEMRDLIGPESVDRNTLEDDLTVVDPAKSRDAVEKRRLAGPIGADDADDGFLGDVKIYRIHGDQAAEALGYILGNENGIHGNLSLRFRHIRWCLDLLHQGGIIVHVMQFPLRGL